MITVVPETGSTNADLLQRLSGGDLVREGDWLIADRQSGGRGRQGRQWSDGAGNFMGSTVVIQGADAPPTATLALVAGLAVYETLVPLLNTPTTLRLKWPNDLLIGGAKLAGILLEGARDAVVIGIGVNLASAPQIEGRETCSLADFGPVPDRDLFAEGMARSFDTELDRWRTFGLGPILRRWQSASFETGTPMTVHEPSGREVSGKFAGLAEDGSLKLRLADGATRAIHAGDVSLS